MTTVDNATIHHLPTVGQRLVEAGHNLVRWQYEVIRLAGDLDASDEWLLEANTAAHWIADSLDMCLSTAREWVRIGKTLRVLPLLDQEFASHGLSYSKVRTLSSCCHTRQRSRPDRHRPPPSGQSVRYRACRVSQRHRAGRRTPDPATSGTVPQVLDRCRWNDPWQILFATVDGHDRCDCDAMVAHSEARFHRG